MTEQQRTAVDAGELARRYLGAFNMRDLDGIEQLLDPDARFPTRDGKELRGRDGVRELLTAAEDANIRIEASGDPQIEGAGRVALPVRVVTGAGDAIVGTAIFEVRDGRIQAFHIVSDS